MKSTSDRESLGRAYHQLWRVSRKLESLGAIFERQNENTSDGFTELIGLGFILCEISAEVDELAIQVEEIGLNLNDRESGGLAIKKK